MNSGLPRVAIRDLSGTWTTQQIGFSPKMAGGISLALDKNDIVHVALPIFSTTPYFVYYYMWYANNSSGSFQVVNTALPTCMTGSITLRSPSVATDAGQQRLRRLQRFRQLGLCNESHRDMGLQLHPAWRYSARPLQQPLRRSEDHWTTHRRGHHRDGIRGAGPGCQGQLAHRGLHQSLPSLPDGPSPVVCKPPMWTASAAWWVNTSHRNRLTRRSPHCLLRPHERRSEVCRAGQRTAEQSVSTAGAALNFCDRIRPSAWPPCGRSQEILTDGLLLHRTPATITAGMGLRRTMTLPCGLRILRLTLPSLVILSSARSVPHSITQCIFP